MVIGRKRTCSIAIDDALVSREHARIFQEGTVYYVEDLGSSNGIYLNELKIRKSPLTIGDRIRIGQTIIIFAADPEENLQDRVIGGSQIQENLSASGLPEGAEIVIRPSSAASGEAIGSTAPAGVHRERRKPKQERASPVRGALWFILFVAFLIILFIASAFAVRLILDIMEK
jgi:pSer/pThr/pTyr-binding forkhead associated (FHA) protein